MYNSGLWDCETGAHCHRTKGTYFKEGGAIAVDEKGLSRNSDLALETVFIRLKRSFHLIIFHNCEPPFEPNKFRRKFLVLGKLLISDTKMYSHTGFRYIGKYRCGDVIFSKKFYRK